MSNINRNMQKVSNKEIKKAQSLGKRRVKVDDSLERSDIKRLNIYFFKIEKQKKRKSEITTEKKRCNDNVGYSI